MKTTTKRVLGISLLVLSLAVFTGCAAMAPTATEAPAATEAAAETEVATATDAVVEVETMADADASLKVFTLDELAQFDGKNGNPAYVAVDGKVYDVTDVPQWNGGSHAGGSLAAGMDQTDAIGRSPHGARVLDSLTVVGTLE